MKCWLTCLAIFLASFRFAIASTIEWNVVSLDVHETWVGFALDGVPGWPYFVAYYEIQGGILTMSVDHRWWSAANAMNFVELHEGDTVDETTVRGLEAVYFDGQWLEPKESYTYQDLTISEGKTAYLGFAVGQESMIYYGWLSIIFDGSGPVQGQSAVELSGNPIVILPRQIPEPTFATLLALGLATLALRRGQRVAGHQSPRSRRVSQLPAIPACSIPAFGAPARDAQIVTLPK